MKLTSRIISTTAIAVILTGTVATAQAGKLSEHYGADEKQGVIQLADVNLSNPADAQTVMAKVRSAAHKVCERDGESLRLEQGRDLARCIKSTYANTVAAINARFGVDLETVATNGNLMPELAAAGK